MNAGTPRGAEARAAPSVRDALLSGLLISLITSGALVRLRLGGLDGPLAEIAGALAGALFVPVAVAQLAARRLVPRPRRVSPLLLHALLVPWAAALAAAFAIVVLTSLALARFPDTEFLGGACAGFGELLAARWSLATTGGAVLVAGLPDGRSVRFEIEAGKPACQSVPSRSRR